MAFPPNPQNGDIYYTEKYVFVYTDGKWVSRILSLDDINANPGGSRSAFFPPFSSVATLKTTLSCDDGKIEFSGDKVGFSSTITVDIGNTFFVEWSSDILTASQGSAYTSTVNIDYLDLNINENLEVNITSIDKLPDPFTLEPITESLSDATVEANTLAMLGSINAPTYIWGSSDSSNAQINIADLGWQAIPTTPGAVIITSKDEIRTRHFTNTGSNTVTTTTINIGYADTPGAFETSDFVTTNESIGVQQPQIVYPDGTSNTLESIWSMPINTSGYGIIGGAGSLASSLWEVATDEEFLNIVFTETVSGTTTNYTLPSLALDTSSTYYARVTFTSSLGYSATSLPVEFLTDQIRFTYLDAAKTSEALPAGLSQYHTVIALNAGDGERGENGIRGQGVNAGSPGAGGTQGLLRFSTSLVGNNTSISLSNNSGTQLSYTRATSNQPGNFDFGTEQIGNGPSGSVITVDDVFSRAFVFSGGEGGVTGDTVSSSNGGGGGGGAGGLKFDYVSIGSPSDDGTWTSDRSTPSSYPTGVTGGDNQPIDGRRAFGGTGGVGYGAGGGGGAGGAERDGTTGSPGSGSPGATGGAIIAII